MTTQAIGVFSHDMTKKGWVLVEDLAEPTDISFPNVVCVPFLKESRIALLLDFYKWPLRKAVRKGGLRGLACWARDKQDAQFGQRRAEFLLEHPEQIPISFQAYSYFIFPGTVWHDEDECERIPCIYHLKDYWCLRFFDWIDFDFFLKWCMLLRLRQ